MIVHTYNLSTLGNWWRRIAKSSSSWEIYQFNENLSQNFKINFLGGGTGNIAQCKSPGFNLNNWKLKEKKRTEQETLIPPFLWPKCQPRHKGLRLPCNQSTWQSVHQSVRFSAYMLLTWFLKSVFQPMPFPQRSFLWLLKPNVKHIHVHIYPHTTPGQSMFWQLSVLFLHNADHSCNHICVIFWLMSYFLLNYYECGNWVGLS